MRLFLNGQETTLSDDIQDDLARSVIISIFTWKRAGIDDVLPGSTREGWWGDTYADVRNDEIGSKLWLLYREKLTDETLLRAKEYVEESLKWLLEDRVASRVEVEVERGDFDRMNFLISITKPDASFLMMRFQNVWEE